MIRAFLIGFGQFGKLQRMRALSLLMLSIYLCVGASPCIGAGGEKPVRSAHATHHAHASRKAHDSSHPAGHRHCEEAAPASKLRPRCPCGCGEGSAAANAFARLGFGLAQDVFDSVAIDSRREAATPLARFIQPLPRAVDHVPIAA